MSRGTCTINLQDVRYLDWEMISMDLDYSPSGWIWPGNGKS